MIRVLKQLFCKHYWVFKRNVWGDEISILNARSIYKCAKCEKLDYHDELNHFI